ncbi:hypothetical protein BpHYR1_033406 [Brachionus plicatilis]|uniref:Uncharacterized protein n=1 Tax=Brachionus plicatilis TaxID=10195 RepID=A0A3M7SC10_BRAPC|nr:hypothetical protein BpHYR1_033406 [Brachionus plicatilis]
MLSLKLRTSLEVQIVSTSTATLIQKKHEKKATIGCWKCNRKINYTIFNVSHQNQLVLASNSAVQDLVENNIQISEKRKRGRPKKSNNESEQPSKIDIKKTSL